MKNLVKSLLILSLLSSCMSVKKAEQVMRAHPSELAKLCADCFPVKESEVKIDTKFIKGKDSLRVDTVEADCPDGTKVKKKCPPCNVKDPDTLVITKEVKLRDTAYEKVLIKERDEAINERDEATKSRNGWRKSSLWAWGIIGAAGLWIALKSKLKKLLPWL